MMALLEVGNLVVEGQLPSRAWRPILKGVNISVAEGEVLALIGESGAGKSTLALAALGYARAGTRFAAGTVRLNGRDVLTLRQRTRRKLRGKEVAYLAQSPSSSLNPSMKLGRQIAEPLIIHSIGSRAKAGERVRELLRLLQFPDPDAIANRYPQQTSGGQQQRAALAMAMSCSPRLLVLDEPTTSLDVTTQIEVLDAIKAAIRQHRCAAIYVSHDLSIVAQIADRIVVMKDGEFLEEGSTDQILRSPASSYTQTLISAVNRKPVDLGQTDELSPIRSVSPLLSLRKISASYSRRGARKNVVHDVDLEIFPNEVMAVVGESGSGKTTLARVIAGLHAPSAGTIEFRGAPLGNAVRARSKDQLRRIQIVFQSPEQSLNPHHQVEDAIGRALKFYFNEGAAERRSRIAKLLEDVGLSWDMAGRFPSELSGGQRQRVSIARALAAKPDVILCDEFLSALDTVVSARILELMKDLQRNYQVAYLYISHDLSTVATIADRVAVMFAGRIVEIGRTADVFSGAQHPYTDLLMRSIPELRKGWLEESIKRRFLGVAARGPTPNADMGCPFRDRCPVAIERVCGTVEPPWRDFGNGHFVRCHREQQELTANTALQT